MDVPRVLSVRAIAFSVTILWLFGTFGVEGGKKGSVVASPSGSPTTTPTSDVSNVLCDTDSWETIKGDWTIDDDECTFENTNSACGNIVWLGSDDGLTPDEDYDCDTFELNVTLSIDSGYDSGVLFRTGECSTSNSEGETYYVGLSPDDDEVVFSTMDDGWTEQYSEGVSLCYGKDYTLSIQGSGDSYSVYVDGTAVLEEVEVTDFSSGSIGLRTYQAPTTYSSVSFFCSATDRPTSDPTTLEPTASPSTEEPTASPTSDPTEGETFVASDCTMSFADAEDYCVGKGMHLASIHSDDENDAALEVCTSCWIGAYRESSSFNWTDGTSWDYTNWASGKPDNDDCARLKTSGQWNDNECTKTKKALCRVSDTTTTTAQPTTDEPTVSPSAEPSMSPSAEPSDEPSASPSNTPSADPTPSPSLNPSAGPTPSPSGDPTATPTERPSLNPSMSPSDQPTGEPSSSPTGNPTAKPTEKPSAGPTEFPSAVPSDGPSADPSAFPSAAPSAKPSGVPTASPSVDPTAHPTAEPIEDPTTAPTTAEPTTASPTTSEPTEQPSTNPSDVPTSPPSNDPSPSPTPSPSAQPSAEPSSIPTDLPTEMPTVFPTYTVCDSNDSLNIAFLMDESGSVDEDEWDIIVNFVDRIATFDVAGASYVSLFEYASLPAFTQFLDWTPVSTGSDDISSALTRNNYNSAGLTYTWDAVNRVLDEFWSYRKNCTDGCETRHDILFLLTDGAPTDDVCPDMNERANTTTVDIVIIGIGTNAEESDSWMSQIDCLDVADDYQDIYYVEEFEAGDFNEIEGIIRNYTCSAQYPTTNGTRGGDPWVYDDGSTSLGPVPTTDGSGNAPADSTPSPVASETTASALVVPVSALNEAEKHLQLPQQLPTSTVIVVAFVLILMFGLYQAGFRCGCWVNQKKSYKRVDFGNEMPSDSDTDIEAAAPINL